MEATPARPITWRHLGLAVLPGIWLILQHRLEETGEPSVEIWTFIITLLVSLGLVVTSLLVEHRLAPWCLSAFGCLLWKASRTMGYLQFARRAGSIEPLNRLEEWWEHLLTRPFFPLLGVLAGGIATIFAIGSGLLVLYWIYGRLKEQKARLFFVLLCALPVVTLALDYLERRPYRWYVLGGVLDLLTVYLPLLLVPIVVGWFLAKRSGLAAGLFVVACEPFWIDLLYSPEGAVRWQLTRMYGFTGTEHLKLALFVLSYLPLAFFFVVIPVGLLAAHSTRAQLGWLVLPSFLALAAITLTRALALSKTEYGYSVYEWIVSTLYVAQLWLPLLLAGVTYRAKTKLNSGVMAHTT